MNTAKYSTKTNRAGDDLFTAQKAPNPPNPLLKRGAIKFAPTPAFFGGEISRFIRSGGRRDTSLIIAAIMAQGGSNPLGDAYGQTGSCWHCQKPWPDMIEGWLSWVPQTGRTVHYGVCFPCHRDWINGDIVTRSLIEQQSEINLIQHFLGSEVTA